MVADCSVPVCQSATFRGVAAAIQPAFPFALGSDGFGYPVAFRIFGCIVLGIRWVRVVKRRRFLLGSNSRSTSMISVQGVGPSYQAQTQKEKQSTTLNAPTVKKISLQSRGSCARTTLPAHAILTSNRFDTLNSCAGVY